MKNNNKLQHKGFSLVEIMISLALGLFIMAGISTVYVSTKETYALRDQISELDENARTAMNALRTHLEAAGYASKAGAQLAYGNQQQNAPIVIKSFATVDKVLNQ